jgi:D-proline reductase (dithiol) PrdB
VEIIEQLDRWRAQYRSWAAKGAGNSLAGYPFIENSRAPFTPARRSLPMMNVALVSSAGAYIDGTEAFDTNANDGDFSFREIPTQIDARDLRFAGRGYDESFIQQDINVEVPLARLLEYEANRVIGQLNSVFWSFCGYIPDAAGFADITLPKLVDSLKHYSVQGVLLVPASGLCHQSIGLAARAIEMAGMPTVCLAVDRQTIERVRPSRAAYYQGELGSVVGKPNWPQHQRRVLDEALRWLEPMGQPGIRKLAVELETQVEAARGER